MKTDTHGLNAHNPLALTANKRKLLIKDTIADRKYRPQKTKWCILLILFGCSLAFAQHNYPEVNKNSNDAWLGDSTSPTFTNNASWSWVIDLNANQSDDQSFYRWWHNGGDDLWELMMQLEKGNLSVFRGAPIPFAQLKAGRFYDATLYFRNQLAVGANDTSWARITAAGTLALFAGNHGITDDYPALKMTNRGEFTLYTFHNNSSPDYRPVLRMDPLGALSLGDGTTRQFTEKCALTIEGAVSIGPDGTNPVDFADTYAADYLLWVEKGIVADDLALVSVDEWRDEVFLEDYDLRPLEELEDFVKTNKHLPGIKPEAEVLKEGYSVKELDMAFLEKIEELVLYTIDQEKKIGLLTNKLEELEKKINLKKQ